MNNLPNLELLDLQDPAHIAEWERAFYRGFSHVTGNRLIQALWIWNHETQRLATRIPYADQLIYAWRDAAGALGICLSVNVAMQAFQSAAFGFAPEHPAHSPQACEILATFNLSNRNLGHVTHFRSTVFSDLYRRGFRRAYLTTAEKNLRMGVRIGAELVAEAVIEGEKRYFLQFTLTPSGVPDSVPKATPPG
jgi:hypothetical protein